MKIAVSACLLGNRCRFDGESRKNSAVISLCTALGSESVVPLCPEVMGGLPCPRDPSEILGTAQSRRVISSQGKDVTKAFMLGAQLALKKAQKAGCKLAILKAKSPSCSSHTIYDGTFSGTLIPGYGIAAQLFEEAGIRVVDETQIENIYERIINARYDETGAKQVIAALASLIGSTQPPPQQPTPS